MLVPPLALRLRALALKALAALSFLPPLLTRVAIGHAFYLTGGGKLANLEKTVAFFSELGIPMPELNAAFVSRLEYYGGMLLVLGLGTRLVAGLFSSTMVVALMTADSAQLLQALSFSGDAGLTDVTPFVYGMLLSWLVIHGPGLLSADALLSRLLGLDRPVDPGSSGPAEPSRPAAWESQTRESRPRIEDAL